MRRGDQFMPSSLSARLPDPICMGAVRSTSSPAAEHLQMTIMVDVESANKGSRKDVYTSVYDVATVRTTRGELDMKQALTSLNFVPNPWDGELLRYNNFNQEEIT